MPDHVLPTEVERAGAEYQPIETHFELADGISVVSNLFVKAGAYLPQHSHDHDHSSVIAHGSANVWQDGKFLGTFEAGSIVLIKANTRHIFQALVDGTVTLCIHRLNREMIEHQLV